jgi:hypothetical protein
MLTDVAICACWPAAHSELDQPRWRRSRAGRRIVAGNHACFTRIIQCAATDKLAVMNSHAIAVFGTAIVLRWYYLLHGTSSFIECGRSPGRECLLHLRLVRRPTLNAFHVTTLFRRQPQKSRHQPAVKSMKRKYPTCL